MGSCGGQLITALSSRAFHGASDGFGDRRPFRRREGFSNAMSSAGEYFFSDTENQAGFSKADREQYQVRPEQDMVPVTFTGITWR